MKLKLNPKTGTYYAQFKTSAGTKQVSTKCRNKDQALQVVKESGLEQIELAARSGQLTGTVIGQVMGGKKLTVADALEHWQQWAESVSTSPFTLNNYRIVLDRWIADMDLGKLPPALITEQHMNQWINQTGDNKCSTRCVQLAALRHFFKYCSAKGWVAGDPSKLVRIKRNLLSHAQKEPRKRLVFTDHEIKRLLKATHPDTGTAPFWFCAIAIGRYTGLRLGDVCQLQWPCFSKPGVMKVWTDKSDTPVLLPVDSPAVLVEAIGYIPYRDPKYCFPDQAKLVVDVSRRALLSMQFTRLCQSLHIVGKSFHSLRHTYATEARRLGKSMPHIAEDLGHNGIEITRTYVHED